MDRQSKTCSEQSRTIANRKLLILCLLCLLSSVFCLLPLSGCDSSSAGRVEAVKNALAQATAVNISVDASIADVEKVIADSQLLLADPNTPGEFKLSIQSALAEASSEKLAVLKAQKQQVVDSIASYQAVLSQVDANSIDLTKEIQLYATGVGEAAKYLPDPYRGYVYLGSALAAMFAGLIASIVKLFKKNQQLDESRKVLTDVVVSVDKLLNPATNEGVIAMDKVADAKFILEHNQSGLASDAVNAIHYPLQNTAVS